MDLARDTNRDLARNAARAAWRVWTVCALSAATAVLATLSLAHPDALRRVAANPWSLIALALLPVLATLATGGLLGASWLYWKRRALKAEARGRRNRALLRTASDGLHVLDRTGRLVKFSDSFAAMLGRSRDGLAGLHVTAWDACYDPGVMATWFETYRPGERRDFESIHRRSDGTLIDVEVKTSMVRIDGLDLIYCSARDVTQRKRLEVQLADSAAQMRSLYDNAPCGYHSLDEHGRYLYINDTELRWLGCGRDDLVGGRSPREFFTEEGADLFDRHFPRLLEGESVDGVEVDLHGGHGERRRVSVSATPMLDAQGRFRMSRTVMYDITHLHRTRERLRRVLCEQDAMLDNDLIGMARLRRNRVVWSNRAMGSLFGYAMPELVGRPIEVLLPNAEPEPAVCQEARDALKAAGRFRSEHELVRRDGTRLWVEINAVMLSRDRRESMWLFADATPRKAAFDRVEFRAFHDDLTALPNRGLLQDRLQHELNAASRRGHRVAVCYLDLDGFKALNDRLGHEAGDLLLKEVAMRLSTCTRAVDTVARLGGDEFVVVLCALDDLHACHEILDRIEAAMHADVPLEGYGRAALSASIGVALFPDHAATPQALLHRADVAMYEAKRCREGGLGFVAPELARPWPGRKPDSLDVEA